MKNPESMATPPRFSAAVVGELFLVFLVIVVYGAWPVPDSNEPYYIGKAVHYWQPERIVGDPFLDSQDAHRFFYVTFGWLALLCSPEVMTWIGRLLCWAALAWSWRRLSRALLPWRGAAVLTIVVFLFFNENVYLANEWIVGGVEGKTFAYPLVFLGLEAVVRGRWKRVWIFLGIASSFHVLVGGWAVLCGLFAWIMTRPVSRKGTSLIAMLPFLLLGGLLALPGLFPVLLLNRSTPPETLAAANETYVYLRIYHHLVPSMLPWTYTARFLLLAVLWFALSRLRTGRPGKPAAYAARFRPLTAFIGATLILALIGLTLDRVLGGSETDPGWNRKLAAQLLRFYWFRLSDWAVPMGIALTGTRLLFESFPRFWKIVRETDPKTLLRSTACLLLATAGLFGCIDYLVFGYFAFSWDVKPDISVVWLSVLLVLFLVFSYLSRLDRQGVSAEGESPSPPCRFQAMLRLGFVPLLLGLLLPAPVAGLLQLGDLRTRRAYSRIDPPAPYFAWHWLDVCRWIASSTPREAKFLIPREAATFKWNAGRADAGCWKDIPQDAVGIVQWRERMEDYYSYRDEEGALKWDKNLTILLWQRGDVSMRRLREKYGFTHIVCPAYPELPHLKSLRVLYRNEVYAVYEVQNPPVMPSGFKE